MANNYVLLDRIELNATAASITFSNIPQTGYTDLKIVVSARTSESQSIGPAVLQFNGVTTSYSSRELYGTGSGTGSASRGVLNNGMYLGNGVGNIATANTFGNMEVYIPNYTSSNYKSVSVDQVGEDNATTAYATMVAGLWSNTAAITSVAIYPYSGSTNWVVGSTFSLYGVAAVGTTPAIAPKADGGNVIATDGTYWYHAFLSNGTFTPQVGLSADVLVVAGGAGGGTYGGGGGGAGGLLAFTSQSLTTSSYTCTVGAGASANTNGSDSQFGALTLVKGGGYGGYGGRAGGTGGSGGGGADGYAGGSATSGQGNNGSAGSVYGGGGGGAGGAGTISNGGAGSNAYSSWASATGTGVSGYYAGGGGGWNTGPGGSGGGTSAGSPSSSAPANTGSGTGGTNVGTAGTGGSGVIIVRYLVA